MTCLVNRFSDARQQRLQVDIGRQKIRITVLAKLSYAPNVLGAPAAYSATNYVTQRCYYVKTYCQRSSHNVTARSPGPVHRSHVSHPPRPNVIAPAGAAASNFSSLAQHKKLRGLLSAGSRQAALLLACGRVGGAPVAGGGWRADPAEAA